MKRPNLLSSYGEEERYRLLVDAITDYAVYMLDRDGYIISWNTGARRFKGYAADEIIGRHLSTFFTSEDRKAGLPQHALATAAAEGRFEGEGWRVRKDGTRFWANAVMDAIYAADGELLGFAKITRDLTERRRAEETLRRSQEQFRLLVASVVDYAIYMVDLDGFVTTWNAGAQRIKGYAPDEIIGRHFSAFYTEEDRKALEPQRALATALREGRYEKESWRLRKDGSRFFANVVIDPVRDESGTVIGFAKVTRDITERLNAQKLLDEARENLFQSQKLEAIGQLTGGVAHDFNNLLMVILSSLDLMRKRMPGDEAVQRLLDNATQAAERGASLTQRMLAFARRQELKREPVDIGRLLEGMRDLLESSVGSRIDLEMRIRLSAPPALTDAHQLETAILNIVLNARDAMPDGGLIIVSVNEQQALTGMAPGRYVRISVADNGQGMDETTVARAAEPFFTTKGVGKGTGLGLSMVHGLAEQSGGRLRVSSIVGQGTTVELLLPVADAQDAAAAASPSAPEPAPAGPPEPRKLRVLAVDDDPLVLMNTAMMLEDMGHDVVEAISGAKALDALGSREFDLVVTDLSMPGMTGLQLADIIRLRWPELKILVATGYSEIPEVGLPKVVKPFSQTALEKAIRQVTGCQGG